MKSANVLLRVVDGQMDGTAKECDVGVSRNAEETMTAKIDSITKDTGTEL